MFHSAKEEDRMAELMGEALISAVLQRVLERIGSSDVVDYVEGKEDYVGLLGKLKTMLLSVSKVLDDAELKQLRETAVKEWLEKLKDAAEEADDLVDDIASDGLQLRVEAESTNIDLIMMETSYSFSYFSCSKDGDRKIKLEEILERLEYLANRKDDLGLEEGGGEKLPQRASSASPLQESVVYGRDDDRDAIMKLLLSDDIEGHSNGICVIPIVGEGGVGKTTLAREIFNNDEVKKHFDLTAWVSVSESDVLMVMKILFEEVTSGACYVRDPKLHQVRLKESLKGKKFLIVLDDMWNENYVDWGFMRSPLTYGAPGSKIIVTTRSDNVASIMATVPTHYLKKLSDEDCWKLFAKHVSGGKGDFSARPDLEEVGREIVKKCKGFPLAAKTLGGLLYNRLDNGEWERILKSEIWDLTDENSNIFPALRLCYHYLPSYLKRCFAYCSIFPKGYEFRKEKLILLWMAEGFLGDKRMEEVGDEYFNDLVSGSFFQPSSCNHDNNSKTFVMHDILVDLAKCVSGKYCVRLENGNQNEVVMRTRHLAYGMDFHDSHKKLNKVFQATRLHTFLPLHYIACPYLQSVSLQVVQDLFLKLRRLRVLSLLGYGNIKQLPDSIGELRHLRYLDLSCTSIKRLPESISLLFNLQTLKLGNCRYLTTLPKYLQNLINLRYLYVDRQQMSVHVSKLKSLQMLRSFTVEMNNGIEELREFPHLRGALSIENLHEVVKVEDAWKANLMDTKHLEKLELKWKGDTDDSDHEKNILDDSDHERNILDALRPNTALKELIIRRYGGNTFPYWVGDGSVCSNVVDLQLYNCKYCFSLPPLGQLPSLKSLHIERFDGIMIVGPEFYGNVSSAMKPFASLESLQFSEMPSWEEWAMPVVDVDGPFQKLRALKLNFCQRLTGDLPHFLLSLTKLVIRGCKLLASTLPDMPVVRELEFYNSDRLLGITGRRVIESLRCLQSLEIKTRFSLRKFSCLPSSLKTLQISRCSDVFEFLQLQSFESLKLLCISDMWGFSDTRSFPLDSIPKVKHFKIERCDNLKFFPMTSDRHRQNRTSLSSLHIYGCDNFIGFPGFGLHFPNLTTLTLWKCEKLKFFPEQLHNIFPALEYLKIAHCPEVGSFSMIGLPLRLYQLHISGCDKLIASRMSWNLQRLPNLAEFGFGASESEDLISFPEEGLLPATVTTLLIESLSCLEILDEGGLRQLTSLRDLFISSCPNLQAIPESGLPTSLDSFHVQKCPLLAEKCQREKGEYWNKIFHMSYISVDDEVIS